MSIEAHDPTAAPTHVNITMTADEAGHATDGDLAHKADGDKHHKSCLGQVFELVLFIGAILFEVCFSIGKYKDLYDTAECRKPGSTDRESAVQTVVAKIVLLIAAFCLALSAHVMDWCHCTRDDYKLAFEAASVLCTCVAAYLGATLAFTTKSQVAPMHYKEAKAGHVQDDKGYYKDVNWAVTGAALISLVMVVWDTYEYYHMKGRVKKSESCCKCCYSIKQWGWLMQFLLWVAVLCSFLALIYPWTGKHYDCDADSIFINGKAG